MSFVSETRFCHRNRFLTKKIILSQKKYSHRRKKLLLQKTVSVIETESLWPNTNRNTLKGAKLNTVCLLHHRKIQRYSFRTLCYRFTCDMCTSPGGNLYPLHPLPHCTFGNDVLQDYNPLNKLFLHTGWMKVHIFFSHKTKPY